MKLAALGANHRTAPLEVREQLHVPSDRLPLALSLLSGAFGQGVVLSTCNRTEFYTMVNDSAAVSDKAWQAFLEALYPGQARALRPYCTAYEDEEAARHLFRVASGLDSMLVGETQVLGQVRSAYSAAVAGKAVHNPLSRLFHQALSAGKRVHTETHLARNALSVSGACVRLARQTIGQLPERTALVIGTGEAGKLAARALGQAGVGTLLLTNRTFARAQELAGELGAEAVRFAELPSLLARADIVVTATEAPGTVITKRLVEQAGRHANGRSLVIMDIAIPRDADPAVRSLPGVSLFGLDDLNEIAALHRKEQQEEVAKAEAIVDEEVARFQVWRDGLAVTPTVASLRRHAEEIRQRELARALRRLSSLSDEERAVVEAMSSAIVQKLLHDPVAAIKAQADPQLLQTVQELFRISPGGRDAEGEH
ncbi:MAG: glutamyl-tRNA reductase [Dehalococcoidia bacterium]|nr:glutamyl-tRNA reductase [Dehalococcoidia bacterium]